MIAHMLDLPRCAVFAGMGLGKTSATFSALDMLYIAGETHPTLVLGPKRVARDTWPDEVNKWNHLRHIEVSAIVGTPTQREKALCEPNASVFTINYENIPWLIDRLGDRWPFRTVVADESTKLKSFRGGYRKHPKTGKLYYQGGGGQRARALGRIAHTHIRRFIELTGTPSPNGLLDLWGQAWFLDAGKRLGHSFTSFTERWFQALPGSDGYSQLKPLPFAQEQIQDRLRDLCLSIEAKDWFDIAEPIRHVVKVDLPGKVRDLYKRMEKEFYIRLEAHDIEASNAGAKSQKLRQLCSGAVYLDPQVEEDEAPRAREWKEIHDLKLDALEEICNEAGGMPVLVVYYFKSDLARLLKAFPKGREFDQNPKTKAAFIEGKIPQLFLHAKSAGHGVDGLQDGTNIIVFFSGDWNLEERDQVIGRIGPVRQMQSDHERPVFIYDIVARDTVDEDIILRHESKREVQDIFMESMKRRVGQC